MIRPPLVPAALSLLLGACAGVDAATDDAASQVRGVVAALLAVDVPAPGVGLDGAIDPLALELLDGELTEDDAVRIALLNNREVRAAWERLGVSAADLVQAGLLQNPVFTGSSVFFFDGGTEVELGLAQPFIDLFWRPLRQRFAEHELAAARAMVAHELVGLAFAVRREFVRVRAAQQLVVLQQEALQAAIASRELMRELAAAGNVIPPQQTAERIGEDRARLALAAAERAAREAREPLNVLLGLWGEHVDWRIAGRLPESAIADLDLDAVEPRSVAQSLELLENRSRIDAAAQRAGLASWQAFFGEPTFGAAALREPGDDWALGPAWRVPLPVFDRGSARSAAADARLRQRVHRHVQIAVEVRAAARLLRTRLELLEQRAQFLQREFLPAQRKLLVETMQNYNAMQIGAFDVLAQKQQQLAAARDHVTTLRDAWLARIDLEELLAGSIPAGARETFWPEPSATGGQPDRGDH